MIGIIINEWNKKNEKCLFLKWAIRVTRIYV